MLDKRGRDLALTIVSLQMGGAGKGVKKLAKMLEGAGVKQVSCRLYEGGHHEMLNETNKAEVYGDLLSWLDDLKI